MYVRAFKWVTADAAIILLLLVVYLPVFHAGFIWDDDAHLTHNPNIVGSGGLRGIWTSGAATYYPLVLTSFWIQHALWSLHPLPYHLVNVIMHALCAILLRHLLLNLGANPLAASLGAIVWALHPVQSESVAWITELKNTQSGVFYLFAILLFLKWREPDSAGVRASFHKRLLLYFAFTLSAVLALLSKTSTVMLPVVLLLCAWWKDGRWNRTILKSVLPLFLISAAAGGWTIWEQKFHSGATGSEWAQHLAERVAVSGYTTWFYLGKLIWPHPLIFLYPRWNVESPSAISFLPTIAIFAAFLLLWRYRNWTRAVFFVFAYFVVSLFPVLDFFDVYFFRYSFVADHFQYLAAMGPLALMGAAIVQALERNGKARYFPIVSGLVIVLLGIMTAQHARIFRDNETLWRDTMAKNPDAWLAHNNLATIFMDQDNSAAAIVELQETLRLQPHYAEAHTNLGNILFESGRFEEAITHFERALESEADYGRIHDYLGVSLMMTGRIEEGIEHMRRAIEIDPGDSTAHENLGIAFGRQGKMDSATAEFKEAVRTNPKGIQPRMRYGVALLEQNLYAEAEAQFAEVLQRSPDLAAAHEFLGIALSGQNRNREAIVHLEDAVRLAPEDEEAKQRLEEARNSVRAH